MDDVRKQVRGDGPRRRSDIFEAALELLGRRGYDGVTIEAVAERSGVNKTTLYRWWPSKDALLAAALESSELLSFNVPDTGTLRNDLLALAGEITRLLTAPATAPVVATILAAAPRSPELADLTRSFFAGRLASEQPIFARAIQRCELAETADPSALMDMLAGAIWFRLLLRGESVTQTRLRYIVESLLAGFTPNDSR